MGRYVRDLSSSVSRSGRRSFFSVGQELPDTDYMAPPPVVAPAPLSVYSLRDELHSQPLRNTSIFNLMVWTVWILWSGPSGCGLLCPPVPPPHVTTHVTAHVTTHVILIIPSSPPPSPSSPHHALESEKNARPNRKSSTSPPHHPLITPPIIPPSSCICI